MPFAVLGRRSRARPLRALRRPRGAGTRPSAAPLLRPRPPPRGFRLRLLLTLHSLPPARRWGTSQPLSILVKLRRIALQHLIHFRTSNFSSSVLTNRIVVSFDPLGMKVEASYLKIIFQLQHLGTSPWELELPTPTPALEVAARSRASPAVRHPALLIGGAPEGSFRHR